MIYDDSRARIVSFGGLGAGGDLLDDTWEWEADQAAQQLDVVLPIDLTRDAVNHVSLRAYCAGDSGPGRSGADLLGWRTGGPGLPAGLWTQLGRNTAGLPLPSQSSLSEIDYATTSAAEAQSLVMDRRLGVQCRSRRSQLAPAQVAVDYIEARIRYTP